MSRISMINSGKVITIDNVKITPEELDEMYKDMYSREVELYRVSWYVGEVRRERFFNSQEKANKEAKELRAIADKIGTTVDPLVAKLEVL